VQKLAFKRMRLTKQRYVQYPVHMNAITYTEARETLAETIRRVCQDHDPIIITRKREDSVVMIALDDYESLTETAYLLRSPRNIRRLLDSIKELEEGKGIEKGLAE
jgi:antitoxin YefM